MKKRIFYSILPILGGIVIGLIISGYIEYESLVKPPFAPPAILFPITWSILYILMGISYFLASEKEDKELDKIYLLQLFLNLLWPIIFFVLKMYFAAFLWLILLFYVVILWYKELYQKKKISAYLQIPYLIWALLCWIFKSRNLYFKLRKRRTFFLSKFQFFY